MNCIKNIIKFFLSIIGIVKLFFQVVFSHFNNRKRCVLISNGFSMSGAPVVLFEVANIYKEEGYDVYIFSQHFGKLTNTCKKEKYHFVVIPFFEKISQYMYLKMKIDFYFVNTVVNFSWIDFLAQNNKKVFWWLHEGTYYINKYIENLRKIEYYNQIKIFAVSPWTIKILKENNLNWNVKLLFYGCKDFNTFSKHVLNNKVSNVLTIGNICPRKNQNFLIDQIEQYNNTHNDTIKLTIIGSKLNEEDEYYNDFLRKIKYANIEYIQYVSHSEIHKYYENADLIVCTSIDDPMPVFITEGFMFGKIVLTSSNTGQFEIIENGRNGFVYSNEKNDFIENLLNIMKLSNEEKKSICNEARLTYEKYFDLRNFNETLMNETINGKWE